MNAIVDIALVAIISLGIIFGFKRGFIKSVKRPVRFFGALMLAFSLSNSFSVGVIEPMIAAPLSSGIESYILENCTTESGEYPTLIKFAASLVGVDLSNAESIHEVVASVLSPLVHFISVIIAFIVLYFLLRLLISLIFKILGGIFEKTPLSVPNKILGAVFCGFSAFAIAWLLTFAFDMLIALPSFEGQAWVGEFTGGSVYQFFKTFGPIDLLLSF